MYGYRILPEQVDCASCVVRDTIYTRTTPNCEFDRLCDSNQPPPSVAKWECFYTCYKIAIAEQRVLQYLLIFQLSGNTRGRLWWLDPWFGPRVGTWNLYSRSTRGITLLGCICTGKVSNRWDELVTLRAKVTKENSSKTTRWILLQ